MPDTHVRNPRVEACALLSPSQVGVVLEPSPPAVAVGPWFADDPVARPDTDRAVVSPVGTGDLSWEDVIGQDAGLAAFARDHWLANRKALADAPASLADTRTSLIALAFNVLAPARQEANGKIGLRWTKGGFGTPFFGDDRQVRVEGDRLVVQAGSTARAAPITTLRAAGDVVGLAPGASAGIEFHDPPDPVDLDELLRVDPAAVGFLDDWFGYGTLVLERLRVASGPPADTRVQLWAEHFDLAIELGDASAGRRATFGVSPGDPGIPAPYLYVAPWTPQVGELWTAPFGGAALELGELRAASDPVEAALAFFEEAGGALR